MKNAPYLRPLDCVARALIGAVLVIFAVMVFHDGIARLVMGLIGAWLLVEATTGRCYLQGRSKSKSFAEWVNKEPLLPLLMIQMLLAYEWWASGWSKLTSLKFLPGFGDILVRFASHNPFPWMKSFLLGPYLHGSPITASLVVCGELFGGVALLVGAILFLWSNEKHVRFVSLLLSSMALTGFMFLNAIFYFAAGWMDPSTQGINVVMFGVEAVLLYTFVSMMSENKVS